MATTSNPTLRAAWFALFTAMFARPLDVVAFTISEPQSSSTRESLCDCVRINSYNVMNPPVGHYGARRRRNGNAALSARKNDHDSDGEKAVAVGLYKKFADYALEALLETGWVHEDDSVSDDLASKQAPAKGSQVESIVKITTKALIPTKSNPLIRYARITLLETVPISKPSSGKGVSSGGIQVLNFVVLPNADTTLPVLGIDLVTLPGSKNLLLLDAQPMVSQNPHESHWEEWYNTHVLSLECKDKGNGESLKYEWGGDFPEAVQKYVSKYALWTRLQNFPDNAQDVIEGDLFIAFKAHLSAYLQLLETYEDAIDSVEGQNHQPSYLDYRRSNDPAKPMLNALYGPEWTQRLLDDVLFPKE